jgi:polyisoprenoid-binding protein YceI
MKLLRNKALLILLVLISGYGYIISCTHDDEIAPPPSSTTPIITRGNNVHLPGNMTAGDTTQWKFDKAHSSALWSTSYGGASGLLTGRFDAFGIHDVTPDKMLNTYYYSNLLNPAQPLKDTSWAFYENEPSRTYFNGYVQINTSNTGEPQRDGTFTYKGCNIDGLGTVMKIANYHNLIDSNLAKIKTTKVEFDPSSADYIVTLNLTWRGKLAAPLTKEIVGRLKYTPVAPYRTYKVFGLQLKFSFNCRDFGITSASIGDKIDVECNINFHNN